jgi:peptidoglycan/xylan/chitin deacetylase (PgdA/CDA1 family)
VKPVTPTPKTARIGRGLLLTLGASVLLLCVLLPAVLAPPDARGAMVPLPVAPVQAPEANTLWRTPRIVGYAAHTVAPDETLAAIAQRGGSSEALIRSYNRLRSAPPPGRPLVVPRLAGYDATLPAAALLVTRGPIDRSAVALTLDAGGGSAPVPDMLATLRAHNVRVTFFLTGAWATENPDLVRQIVADGHELANHSLTHADFTALSDAAIQEELRATEQIIQEIAGTTTRPFFRPPYGAYNERVLLTVIEQGYLPVYWTLDSLDSVGEPKTPAFLLERITNSRSVEDLRGAIILAHCGSQATADALPAILERFDALGLEVRPLSEVLGP